MASTQFITEYSSTSSTSSSSFDEDQDAISLQRRKQVQTIMALISPVLVLLPEPKEKRRYIYRNRERGHQQIWRDYFANNSTYPYDYFRRRYRMRKELFLRILKDIEAKDDYFVPKEDCTGRFGCSSLQKMTTAIRILAYGASTDQCDEYVKMGESTGTKSMKHFCKAIIEDWKWQNNIVCEKKIENLVLEAEKMNVNQIGVAFESCIAGICCLETVDEIPWPEILVPVGEKNFDENLEC